MFYGVKKLQPVTYGNLPTSPNKLYFGHIILTTFDTTGHAFRCVYYLTAYDTSSQIYVFLYVPSLTHIYNKTFLILLRVLLNILSSKQPLEEINYTL